jgi:signal transduction histidine kinase
MERSELKILIVDDIPENLQVVASTLEPEGYQLRFAEDGESALEAAAEETIDLILLDIMMPGMDGFEVCQRLKSNPETHEIPIIFITAKADNESTVKGFRAGGVDYVTKPFQVEELRARVGTHLRLRQREIELEELNQAKDRFLSVLSHDLKIPMRGINGFLGVMQEQFEQMSIAELRENLRLLSQAADNFTNMVQNMLGYSSIQSGLAAFRPDELELNPILEEVVSMFAVDGEQKGIEWLVEADRDSRVFADLEMTQSVLRNLVANAVKYSDENGVIRLSAVADDADVIISVEDEGCGISEDNLTNLFELDRDVKEIGARGEIASGMGLVLARECVERHGGRIWVESDLERGTRVSFTLPSM